MAKAQNSPALWAKRSPGSGYTYARSPNGSFLSPPMAPLRGRLGSNASSHSASFLLDEGDAAAIQQAIDESLNEDTKRRMSTALQDTFSELCKEYPEEMAQHDFKRARRKSSDDLDTFMGYQAIGEAQEDADHKDFGVGEVQEDADHKDISKITEQAEMKEEDFLWHDGQIDHEQLMAAIYASQGLDLAETQSKAKAFLENIGLKSIDLGVKNKDEVGREMINQCFYLSIARCYLGPTAGTDQVGQCALLLKRTIESAVLNQHPEWRDRNNIGDDLMSFADWLPMAMHSQPPTFLSGLAVVVLDSVGGHVEVYLGPKNEEVNDRAEQEKNLILLWFTPGHYQALVRDDVVGSRPNWTYPEFKKILEEQGVIYIETLE